MKTINQRYENSYRIVKRLFWLHDPFGLLRISHLNGRFSPMASMELETIFRIKYPKRKKVDLRLLDENTITAVKEKWIEIGQRYLARKERQYTRLTNWLNDNAGKVVLSAEWQECYKQEAYTYSSQTDPMGYVLGDVKRKAEKLARLSIPYEIRRFGIDKDGRIFYDENLGYFRTGTGLDRWYKTEKGYTLYAPITDYMLDAIERNNPETLLEWAVNCWRNGQNPKVIRPFLPDEIFQLSSDMVFGQR